MKPAWKFLARNGGMAAMILGSLAFLAGVCGWMVGVGSENARGPAWASVWLLGAAALVTGGWLAFSHAGQSQAGLASPPVRFFSPLGMVFLWGLAFGLSTITHPYGISALCFPGSAVLAVGLPLLAVLAILLPRGGNSTSGPTRRQFFMALTAGMLVAPALAGAALVTLSVCLSAWAKDFPAAVNVAAGLLDSPSAGISLGALNMTAFVWLLAGVALLLPVALEAGKSLAIFPWAQMALAPQRLFWIGAAAGAGFAFMQGIVFIALFPDGWTGAMVTLSLGAAIHPVAGGLAALAWRELLGMRIPASSERFFAAALWGSAAIGVEAVWNTTLLLCALYLENLRAVSSLLGVGGMALFFLPAGVGLATLFLGRDLSQWLGTLSADDSLERAGNPARRLAVWALACLLVLAPLWSAVVYFGRLIR